MKRWGDVGKVITVLVLALFLVSCGLIQVVKDNPWSEMTPKEKGVMLLGEYNGMYRDYKRQAARIDLTEPEKIVLREKKALFTKVYPLIKMYESYVDNGLVITQGMEDDITNILNQLGSTLIKKLME